MFLTLYSMLNRNTYRDNVNLPEDVKQTLKYRMAQFVHRDERTDLLKIDPSIITFWKHVHIVILLFSCYVLIVAKGSMKIYSLMGIFIVVLMINAAFFLLWIVSNWKVLHYKKTYKIPAYVMYIRFKSKSTVVTVGYYNFRQDCFVSEEYELNYIVTTNNCPKIGSYVDIYVSESVVGLKLIKII